MKKTKGKLSVQLEPLTLKQLKAMDGQRVLIPETTAMFGGFGVVNAKKNRVESPNLKYNGWWDFSDYKIEWIAYKDPFGVVGENHDE